MRTTKTELLALYKSKVMDDNGNIYPERAWDASAKLACEKVEIENPLGPVDPVKSFHKFGCVTGVYAAYHQCSKHSQAHISTNDVNVVCCQECEHNIDAANERAFKIPRI